jgi:hypothetical protein
VIVSEEIEKLRGAYANRDGLEVAVQHGRSIPADVTLVRVSWSEHRYMRAGNVEARPVVLWFSWGGDKFCGSSPTRKGAIAIAQVMVDLQRDRV